MRMIGGRCRNTVKDAVRANARRTHRGTSIMVAPDSNGRDERRTRLAACRSPDDQAGLVPVKRRRCATAALSCFSGPPTGHNVASASMVCTSGPLTRV